MVQCVGNLVASLLFVSLIALEETEFLSLTTFLHILLVTLDNSITGSLSLLVQRRLTLFYVWTVKVGTAEEVESALAQVLSQLIVHIAVRLMAKERCRCGMCYSYTGSYAYGLARVLGPLSNTIAGGLQILQYTDSTILGLLSGCQSCTTSSRVSNTVSSRIGINHTHNRQA